MIFSYICDMRKEEPQDKVLIEVRNKTIEKLGVPKIIEDNYKVKHDKKKAKLIISPKVKWVDASSFKIFKYKWWGGFSPEGILFTSTLSTDRIGSIFKLIGEEYDPTTEIDMSYKTEWDRFKKMGYRVKKVKITIEPIEKYVKNNR